ncbi:MAG: family 43 glycosylhydrolase [Lachnospiraceae bacterium]
MNQNNYLKTDYNDPFIPNRADPYICHHQDTYYFTASVPEYDRIILRQAASFDGLRDAAERTLWQKHDEGIMSIHIWAPELHYMNGKWYIYYAAGDKADVWKIRPYVLECAGDPMTDEWRELGQVEGADEFTFQDFSLDMTVFEHRQQWYCIWAEKVSVGKKISNLYIARLETPWKLATQQILLTSPDYKWEREGFWVNEAPAVIGHQDRLYLTYSASSTGACYCMGMLSVDQDQDILDPSSWIKEKEPIFKTDVEKGLFGPGHNSFLQIPGHKAAIMVYHARPYDEINGDPLYDPNRHAYLGWVNWADDGPVFSAVSWKEMITMA